MRLDAVEQVRGKAVDEDVEIEPHPGYLTDAFGSGNPAEVFAKISKPFWLRFSDGGGDRSGGVITPDQFLVNLSRKLGPQPGKDEGPDPSALPMDFKPDGHAARGQDPGRDQPVGDRARSSRGSGIPGSCRR